jgi:hypothetical protein
MLILLQAIVSASRSGSEWTNIAGSTTGILFLGTPHRGCVAANWGVLVATLGQWGVGSEPRILKSLENHSDALIDLLRDFSGWLWQESVPVVCCFENETTDYVARITSLIKVPILVRTPPIMSATYPDSFRLWTRTVPALMATRGFL